MSDPLDRLIADLSRFSGASRTGALDEENATKLSYAEFGTVRGVPPRPVLSATYDRLEGSLVRVITGKVRGVVDGRGRGATGQEIVADAGRDLADEVRAAIGNDTPPPLAPSTAAARRRAGKDTRTLVDTGDMRESIRSEASPDPHAWDDDVL